LDASGSYHDVGVLAEGVCHDVFGFSFFVSSESYACEVVSFDPYSGAFEVLGQVGHLFQRCGQASQFDSGHFLQFLFQVLCGIQKWDTFACVCVVLTYLRIERIPRE
jgi:hypothetical protein